MTTLTNLALGLALGYALASLTEHFFHRHVGHASDRTRRAWRRFPRLCGPFRRAYYSHHVVHHARTYRRGFSVQFRSADDKARVDWDLPPACAARIRREWYGVTVAGGRGYLMHVAPAVPAVAVLAAAGTAGLAAGLVPLLVVYPAASALVHPHRHPHASRIPGRAWRWLARTRAVRFMRHAHRLHHADCRCNFNLPPGADVVFRTSRVRRLSAVRAARPGRP